MPVDDRYGNILDTQSAAAQAAYITGTDLLLAGRYGASQAFDAAIAGDPTCALAHAGRARAAMYDGDISRAKAALETAKSAAATGPDRVQSHVATFDLIVQGKAAEARAHIYRHVAEHPRDALVAQVNCQVFGLIGFSGNKAREAEMLAYTSALAPHYGEDWWFLSVHAQSLCETGSPQAALDMMERSLAGNSGNANASHFKSHALYEMGQTGRGRAYLETWMESYDARGVLHGHLSWHQALWALEEGDLPTFWALYDGGIAPGTGPGSALALNTLTDAAALLWRAELAGVSVAPERWRAVSAFATAYFPTPGQSFADLHAALAHAMAGDGAALARLTETQAGFAGDLVGPVAKAWAAIAREAYAAALSHLTPVMADHARFGGSRAQRDVLELTWVSLLLRLGLKDEARRALATRRPVFAKTAPVAGLAA